jgi:hypothetical protein
LITAADHVVLDVGVAPCGIIQLTSKDGTPNNATDMPISLLAKFKLPSARFDDFMFPSISGRQDSAMLEKLKNRCLACKT